MLYTPTQALRHLRALATKAAPNCVNLDAIDRVVAATTFTEASTEEALLILDDARTASLAGVMTQAELDRAVDMAIQKLRAETAPVHDAEALAQLAEKHPIELPWMQNCQCETAQGLPVCGGKCQKGGEGA